MYKEIDCVCFALNDNSNIHRLMSLKMVTSLRRNHQNIQVFCLYSGENKKYIKELEKLEVSIINKKLSFEYYLMNSKKLSNIEKEIAKGAYLMVDIPIHINNNNYALYVDCDIIFLNSFRISELPHLLDNYILGACSEINWGDSEKSNYFNTGFVLVDLYKMRKSYDNFVSSIIEDEFNYIAYDQGSINKFYFNKIMALPDNYNFKPYWLRTHSFSDAKVLHFHGLKPYHFTKIVEDNNFNFLENHQILTHLIEIWGSKEEVIEDIRLLMDIYDSI